MANKQDIITAISNSSIFLKVPALEGASVRLNKNGSPYVFAGGFNMVFQLTKDAKVWAFRVWHVPMGENKERYQLIAQYLAEKKLPYFADFIFDTGGLLVNGELLDTIRMEWLEGKLLKEYLELHLQNRMVLKQLGEDFLVMMQSLREHKIAHGDLQEGNILVTEEGAIKLVDYDSICIPSIEGERELVTGLKGYQHPSRFKGGEISLTADYFSELIIYLSIKALAEQPNLWDKYDVKDTSYLLFTEVDFEDLTNSAIYEDLQKLSPEINKLISILILYLNTTNYTELVPFSFYLAPPKILFLDVDRPYLMKGMNCNISWEIENAKSVSISNIGTVPTKGSITISPTSSNVYVLKVVGMFEEIEEIFKVNVLPTPVTEPLNVPKPQFVKPNGFTPLEYLPNKDNIPNSLSSTNFFKPPSFEKLSSNSTEIKALNKKSRNIYSKIYHELKSKFFK